MTEFELTDEIKQLGISKIRVTKDSLYIYNGKSFAQSKFYKGELKKTLDELEEKMIYGGCFGNKRAVQKIILLLSEIWVKYEENKQKQKQKESSNTDTDGTNTKKKEKHEFPAYKYSNRGKGPLHEAIILAGKPVFLKYDSKAAEPITSVEIIEEDTRIIKPPHMQNYPYDPYEFENMNEVISYLERARNETVDSLYKQSKQIASDYNDQNKYKIRLLAIDIIWAYFQDRFPTTHYDIVLGSPGSGKSSYGETFAAVSYRVVNLTDPNAANINRILGTIEPGQCTIVSDETGAIDKHLDLMAILKTGYSIKGKTSKINDYSREPEFYSTFCFKMIIAEKMPNLRDAKGVYDRSFSFTAFKGRPRHDIKETLEPQGNPARQERLDTLNDFRKLMLVYRLLHFKDPIDDISVGVEGREKELSKPIIQLFYGSTAQKEVEETLQYWLNQRNEKKDTTLEPVLYPIVTKLVSASKTSEVYVSQIWDIIINDSKGGLSGLYDEKKPNEFQSQDYGTIYRNQIYNILEHTFGGIPKHREKGNTYTFDQAELLRVGKAYNIKTSIQTKIVTEDDPEDPEDPEGSIEAPQSKNEENNDNLRGKSSLKEADNSGSSLTEPSEPSEPSAEDTRINESLYRLRQSDTWGCKNCKIRDDKWGMQKHDCKGLKQKNDE